MAAILLLALAVRLATVRFGLPALNDPDELMFEMGALRMLRGPTLNPGWFGHPATTTMYVLAVVNVLTVLFALATGRVASPRGVVDLVYADPSWIILPGRVAMVAFAVWSVWLTWRLAARFFGARAGAVAALLLTLNPVAITWSQIIRSDMMACTFMLLCLTAAADIAERTDPRGHRRAHARAALWLGLAIATKWPFALTALAIGGAALVAARAGIVPARRAALAAAATGVAAIAVLVLVSPYLVLDHATVMKNIRGEGQVHHLGATGGGFAANLWWYLSGPLYRGFGAGGAVLLVAGLWRLARHRVALAVLAPVALAFVALFSHQNLVWERWALPLMPLGAIVAGAGFVVLADALARLTPVRAARAAVPAGVLAACLVPLALAAAADGRARMTDTRQLASAWARRHVPPGRTILVEHFAFDIVPEPWRFLFPMGDAGCVDAGALLRGKIDYATIERARGTRSNVDYGTIAPARADTCRADVAILTQYDRYRREQALFPREAATYRRLLATGTVRATFTPQPGRIAGPVVRIVTFPRR